MCAIEGKKYPSLCIFCESIGMCFDNRIHTNDLPSFVRRTVAGVERTLRFGAKKLKDAIFSCEKDTQWIVAVLRSLVRNHRNLQKISIYTAYILNGPDRADYYDDPMNIRLVIGETNYQRWLELDRLLASSVSRTRSNSKSCINHRIMQVKKGQKIAWRVCYRRPR